MVEIKSQLISMKNELNIMVGKVDKIIKVRECFCASEEGSIYEDKTACFVNLNARIVDVIDFSEDELI